MELVAIGGPFDRARMPGGTELEVTAAGSVAADATFEARPPTPGAPSPDLHAPAEPSLPPPWALSGARAVAELLVRRPTVLADAHAAYLVAASEAPEEPTRQLVV